MQPIEKAIKVLETSTSVLQLMKPYFMRQHIRRVSMFRIKKYLKVLKIKEATLGLTYHELKRLNQCTSTLQELDQGTSKNLLEDQFINHPEQLNP